MKPATPFTPATPRFGMVEHLPAIAIVSLTAMLVVAHLVPCDAAAAQWHNVAPIMLWMLLLLGWSLAGLLRGKATLVLDPATVALVVLTLVPAISAGYLCITSSGNCRLAMNLAWQWASFGVLFFLARQWLKTAADVRLLAAAMIALAAGLAVFAVVQYCVLMPQMRADFERDPDAMLRAAGLDPNVDAATREHFRNRLESKEPTATFALTNSLAGLLTPWLVLLCGIGITALLQRRAHAWRPLVPLVLVAAALVLTKSRTAYLATVSGIALALMLQTAIGKRLNWSLFLWLGVAVAIAALLGIVGGAVDVEVLSEAPKSLLFRLQYWQATAQLIRDFPLLGAGPGNFQDTYKWYQLPEASENIADPHNFILEIGATAGAPGLVALLVAIVLFALKLRNSKGEALESSGAAPLTAPYTAHAIGLATGVLLGYGCGFLADITPALDLLYTAAPVTGLVFWLLRPWVLQGELQPSLVVVSIVALLANLLAAGGISFPGVATSAWLLLAMALTLVEQPARTRDFATIERPLSRGGQLGWFALAAAAGLLFHTTVYNPVFRASAVQSEATLLARTGQLNDAIAAATSAAELDPASPQFWMSADAQAVDLTDLWFTRIVSEGDSSALRAEFRNACAQAIRLDPRSAVTRTQLGHRSIALYRQFGKPQDLQAAVQYYQDAMQRYPNNALVHAQLAWAWHLEGEESKARAEAELAVALDGQHEHQELKLAKLQIYDTVPAPRLEQPAPPAQLAAEPIVQQLRKASTP